MKVNKRKDVFTKKCIYGEAVRNEPAENRTLLQSYDLQRSLCFYAIINRHIGTFQLADFDH